MRKQYGLSKAYPYLFGSSLGSIFLTIFSWLIFPFGILILPVSFIIFGILAIYICEENFGSSIKEAGPRNVFIYFLYPVLLSFLFFYFVEAGFFEGGNHYVSGVLSKFSIYPDEVTAFVEKSEMYLQGSNRGNHLLLILVFGYSSSSFCSLPMYYLAIRIKKSIYRHVTVDNAFRLNFVFAFVLIISIFATYEMFKNINRCILSENFQLPESMMNICEAYARGGVVFYLHIIVRITSIPLIFVLSVALACHLQKMVQLKIRGD